ncbi:MAG TPA: YceI family protein [Saprospiraceae bacterium]|nr:YceI family protein [Saprospiraceae bacterium]HMQ82946.1 YceI family protein [Saprospiraceae bacterium]
MKKIPAILILTLAFVFAATMISAQASFKLVKYEMSISGTSTLHDWTSSVNEVSGSGALEFADGKLKGISSLEITVPVKSIKSTKGKVMDNKTYGALKSDEFPNIKFQLSKVLSITETKTGCTVKVNGYLTIAGTKKWVELTATGTYVGSNGIRFVGSKAINMKDYNMEPPTALMGTLHTGEEVTIAFSVTMETDKSSTVSNH